MSPHARAVAQCEVGVSQREVEAQSTYRVEEVTRDGEREPLLTGLSAEEARYVERELAVLLETAAL